MRYVQHGFDFHQRKRKELILGHLYADPPKMHYLDNSIYIIREEKNISEDKY